MTFAGKAVLFWLAYAVIFSVVIGWAVKQAQPYIPKQVFYQEIPE